MRWLRPGTTPGSGSGTQGVTAYARAIESQPERFREPVERFVRELTAVRRALEHLRQLGVEDPRIAPAEQRYRVLVAGLTEARPQIEGPPLLAVAGVGLGLVGIAWAVAAYQYAVHLREHTALLEKELVARVEASREGRALQPSTVVTTDRGRVIGWVLLGGLALGAVGLVWRGRTA